MTDLNRPDEKAEHQAKAVAQLNRSLKVTAGARFNASKRLQFVDTRLTALMAFSSAMIVGLTVWPKFVPIDPPKLPWVELFTVAISLLLLAASLLQYAKSFAVKAELFHRSALDMQELRRELQFESADLSGDEFRHISERYNAVLQRYNINHDDVDFYRYQIEFPEMYQLGRLEALKKRAQIFVAYKYPSFVLFTIIVLAILLMFTVYWPTPAAAS